MLKAAANPGGYRVELVVGVVEVVHRVREAERAPAVQRVLALDLGIVLAMADPTAWRTDSTSSM